MDWVRGFQHAMDYMEEHLTESTDYEKIACEMNISVFYFQRIFTILCGMSPGEYIRNRRLSLAGSELVSTDHRIIDIALKYGYDTPEGFTRAFTKFHGAAPNVVRRNHLPIKSFAPLRISISVKGGKSMNYRIVEKEAFTVLEKVENHAVITDKNKHAVITDKNKYEISDFWDRVKKDGTVQTLVNALADGKKNLMGICYNDSSNSSESFSYSVAAVCDENCTVPDGYRINCIPARTWAIFECKGAMPDAIQKLWHRIVTEFFPTKDYEPTYEMDIEDYPDGDATSVDYTCWLWIPVRKK